MPQRKTKTFLLFLWAALSLLISNKQLCAWGTNARNDPFPQYSTLDPQYFLSMRERELIKGYADEKGSPERVSISFSPFGQNANKGKKISGTYQPQAQPPTTDAAPLPCDVAGNSICNPVIFPNPSCFNDVELGDLDGRWNLLGLLAGPTPEGSTFPAPALLAAANKIFPNTTPGEITSANINAEPNTQVKTFGYVSVPLKYRKRGIRWDAEAQICGDFGLQFQGGIAEISQVLNCAIKNLTTGDPSNSCPNPNPNLTQCNINQLLFDQLPQISEEINLNLCNFTKIGIEDLYFTLYWRHIHNVNFNRDLSWARFQIIPFFRAGGSVAAGRAKDPSRAFSLPFGNNGHNAANLSVGINLDFVETVEVGGEVGISHFFARDICNFRLPTNELQSGIFPFGTNVKYQPGDTAYFAGKLAAYHFLDRLSFWFQWVFIHHRYDHVIVANCDPTFITAKCPNTVWRVQLGNIALNYDVSPSISLGVLWQQPFHVRNAYNSTTLLASLNIIF